MPERIANFNWPTYVYIKLQKILAFIRILLIPTLLRLATSKFIFRTNQLGRVCVGGVGIRYSDFDTIRIRTVVIINEMSILIKWGE